MPSDAKTIRKMWELNDENVRLRKVLEQARQAIESAVLTHTEMMSKDAPWSENSIIEGCLKGFWSDTPQQLLEALAKIEDILTSS